MGPSTEQLKASYSRLSDQLGFLENLEQDFVNNTNGFVRWSSDLISGAGDEKGDFYQDIERVRFNLKRAQGLLDMGDLNGARLMLKTADHQLARAKDYWNKYVAKSDEGAKGIANVLKIEGAGSAGIIICGGIGLLLGLSSPIVGALLLSGGIHGMVLGVPIQRADSLTDQPDATQEDPVGVAKEPPNKKTIPDCSKNEGRSGKSADVDEEQCQCVYQLDPLEVTILNAIREPKDLHSTPHWDLQKLITEAQQALEEWKGDHEAVPDYGKFLIESEAAADSIAGDRYRAIFSKWEKGISKLKGAVAEKASAKEKIVALMELLYSDYLTIFSRPFAKLINFLEGNGGNCEAQAKLVASAMAATDLKPASPERFAIQVFQDHVAPVIYNSETDEAWNLIDGERTDELRAPLYDPHVFFHAFLKGHGATSPVTDDELLIAGAENAAPVGGWHPSFSTNTNLSFPLGEGYYNNGSIPAYAYMASPYQKGAVQISRGTGAGYVFASGHSLGYFSDDKLPALALSDFANAKEQEEVREYMLDQFPGLDFCLKYTSINEYDAMAYRMLFSTEGLRDSYNSLTSDEERLDFLLGLAVQKISDLLNSPKIKRTLELSEDPTRIERYTSQEVREAILAAEQVKKMISSAGRAIAETHTLPGTEGMIYDDKIIVKVIRGRIHEINPSLWALELKEDALRERIKARPVEFILFMDRLPSEKRMAFLDLIDKIGYEEVVNERGIWIDTSVLEALAKTAADPRIIGLEKTGYESELIYINVVHGDWPVEDLDKSAPPRGKPAEENKVGSKGKKSAESTEKSNSRYLISTHCMIDLILKLGMRQHYVESFNKLTKRWNPRLSRQLLKINKDGRYDVLFFGVYEKINKGYPTSKKTVTDPLYEAVLAACESAKKEGVPSLFCNDPFNSEWDRYGHKIARDILAVFEAIGKRRPPQPTKTSN